MNQGNIITATDVANKLIFFPPTLAIKGSVFLSTHQNVPFDNQEHVKSVCSQSAITELSSL